MGGKAISEAIPEEVTSKFSLKDKKGLINEGMKKEALGGTAQADGQ